MYKALSAPLAVQVEITDNCNQICSHCYRNCPEIRKSVSKKMSKETVALVANKVIESGAMSVTFTGGEPLMYPKILSHGIGIIRNAGLDCCVNTNLQVLPDDMVDFLAREKIKVLTSMLSSDSVLHDKIVGKPGAFDKLVSNIKKLVSSGTMVSINTVVRNDTADGVYETGLFAHSLGASKYSATKAAPSVGTDYASYRATPEEIKESLDVLIRINQETGMFVDILESYPLCFFKDVEKYARFIRRNCTAGIFNCSISPTGEVRPCSHADMSYGNLFEVSLRDCWMKMSDWRNGVYLNDECKRCQYVLLCTGGCRMDAKLFYGDIRGRDPLMLSSIDVSLPDPVTKERITVPDVLYVSDAVKLREESFGGVAKRHDDIVYLNVDGFNTMQKLKSLHSFKWREYEFPVNEKEEIFDFVSRMFNKRFFKERR